MEALLPILGPYVSLGFAPAPPSNSCVANVTVGGILVRQPALVPTCLLAAFIGIHGFLAISRVGTALTNSLYRVPILSYAFMMTSSMLINCFLPSSQSAGTTPSGIQFVISLIDLGLTSSIAYAFGINGLIDVGILKPVSLLTYVLMFGGYGALFGAWYYVFVAGWWMKGFLIFYIGLTAVSGLIYMICQGVWLAKHGTQGITWALVAGVSGGVGLSAITLPKWQMFFCSYLGPELSSWLNGQFWWFVLSDVAVWALLQYVLRRDRSKSSPAGLRSHIHYDMLTSEAL